VLNPVRADLVADPEAWPWSSFRATATSTLTGGAVAEPASGRGE
jgi:hypothetical protein